MSKQDRQGVRTAADLERKYGFGQSFAKVYNLINETQENAREAIEELNKELDTEEIFNRLTNYGAIQTIYRDSTGNIYINASYIKSGKLAAEYIDAENLKVKAANITGTLNANNVKITNLDASNITGGTLNAGMVDIINLSFDKIEGCSVDAKYVTIDNLTANSITSGDLYLDKLNVYGTIKGVDFYGCAFFAEDEEGYSMMYPNEFAIYADNNSRTPKICLQVRPNIGDDDTEAACITLGDNSMAYVQKYYSTKREHMLWIGNGNITCGILFNFSTKEYRIFGTENNSMVSAM